MDIKQ
jgi:hypothetical protein